MTSRNTQREMWAWAGLVLLIGAALIWALWKSMDGQACRESARELYGEDAR